MSIYDINSSKEKRRFLFLISSKIFKDEKEISDKMIELNMSFGEIYSFYAQKAREENDKLMEKYFQENPNALAQFEFLGRIQIEGLSRKDEEDN